MRDNNPPSIADAQIGPQATGLASRAGALSFHSPDEWSVAMALTPPEPLQGTVDILIPITSMRAE
jgi:hypothetical protein